jgi:cyclophilin family peptidyl-prolyl cis-trans isomerase
MRRALTLCSSLLLALALCACGEPGGAGGGGGAGEAPPGKVVALREGDPIAEVDAYIARTKPDVTRPDWRTRLPAPVQVGFPKDKHVHWVLETNKGRLVVRLWHSVAPLHASNLIYLTRLGFYDGLVFHRVIQTFMAQGGCPRGNGTGMPGYGLPLEVSKTARHDRAGLLSTANTGRPGTDGSQFFLTFRPAPELDGGYTVYGEIVEGMDTLRALEAAGAPARSGRQEPREKLVITKATVELR